ncbi:MAG: response regulator transcription factor [bacterium]
MPPNLKLILVIEDEAEIQELIAYNLERDGYLVSCASTGEEGYKIAVRERPDLILLDIRLPGMDGLDVCKLLKNNEITGKIPVIMLTARAEVSDIVTGLEIGADDYITKPFSPKILIARIRSRLRASKESPEQHEPPIRSDRIFIDPGRHEVKVDNKRVNLTATEFELLTVLVRNAGWVMKRYDIVNSVRGDDAIVTDRSVDVLISGLRKKLGEFGNYIETVRGVGYRFRE